MEMLRKLQELVSAGATLLAPKPIGSPSLSDAAASSDFGRLVETLWGSATTGAAGHALGKGRVFDGREVEPLLAQLSSAPDLTHTKPAAVGRPLTRPMPLGDSDDDLVYIHRHISDSEIYFLATQKLAPFDTSVTFRVSGRTPSAWNPMTGERSPVSYRMHDGLTTIPLHFDAYGSTFLIFDNAESAQAKTIPLLVSSPLRDLSGDWMLAFPGGTAQTIGDSLPSWTEFADPARKYFSGTATYSRTIVLTASDVAGDLALDLGDVREIAQVSINVTGLNTILWAPPYRVDTQHLLHAGSNTITVEVTNLWPNRLIGDEQPSAVRQTFTGIHAYPKDSPLFPSGMLGPVTLLLSK